MKSFKVEIEVTGCSNCPYFSERIWCEKSKHLSADDRYTQTVDNKYDLTDTCPMVPKVTIKLPKPRVEIKEPESMLKIFKDTRTPHSESFGQFSGIDEVTYKINGTLNTFVLEGNTIIEAYTEQV